MNLPKRAFIRPILAVMKKYPWTELQNRKGDQVMLEKIEEARSIPENRKDALSRVCLLTLRATKASEAECSRMRFGHSCFDVGWSCFMMRAFRGQ
jgi:hypothetical protein